MFDQTQKKIVFVTGTRADFGKMLPLAKAAHGRGFKVSFFVTGMHMMPEYGETRKEVRRHSEFGVFEYVNHRNGDRQDEIFSKTMLAFSDWCHREKPDLVIVHGDRVESLACALSCAVNYVPVAHVEGGEVSGTIDEVYRHCNSKLCTAHFVSSRVAKERLCKLGEHPDIIYVIGSPELDIHASQDVPPLENCKARYEIPYDEYGILIFHTVTSEIDTIRAQAEHLLEAVGRSGKPFLCIASNNDPGSDQIMEVIRQHEGENLRVIPSIRFEMFSRLLRNAKIVIGNSSLGVREAPFLGIPSINIGTRQNNRSMARSITHLSAFDIPEIQAAINGEWSVRYDREPGFGLGNASEQFVHVLMKAGFWNFRKQKVFYDHQGEPGAASERYYESWARGLSQKEILQ